MTQHVGKAGWPGYPKMSIVLRAHRLEVYTHLFTYSQLHISHTSANSVPTTTSSSVEEISPSLRS
jgi:hypothetical protein